MKPLLAAQIPHHAINRFVERGGAATFTRAEEALTKMLATARQVTPPACALKGKSPRVIRRTRWYRHGDWILVRSGDAIVTVYPATGQWRWA